MKQKKALAATSAIQNASAQQSVEVRQRFGVRRCCAAFLRRQSRSAANLLRQLAEPAQRDGSLGIVDFVAAVERADPDPLKSGAFD